MQQLGKAVDRILQRTLPGPAIFVTLLVMSGPFSMGHVCCVIDEISVASLA